MILGKTSLNNKFLRIMVYSNTTKYSTQHTSPQSQKQQEQKDNKTPKQPPKNNAHNFSNKLTALTQFLVQPSLASSCYCQGIPYDLHHIQQPYEDVSNTTGHLQ